ncbi:TonB-dependent receptor [Rufibacter roseus]|uniref:TonB-dependent receptor n=1 Tax=Rufibacter roseus TaxID=1567108 RepID=A0ABW2DQL8_9BACT|nr:hypothetical protein [Rufibacter roseus]
MRKSIKGAGISALFLLGLLPATHAQTGWGEGNKLESTEIVVEKNRIIELPEANRNFQQFRIDPPELAERNVTYRFNEYRLPEHFINMPMRVLTIRQEELAKLYGNYLKAGFGNYGTVYARGYFHNKRSDKSSFGAQVGHLSSANGPVDESGAATSYVQAQGDMYQGPYTFGGRVRYERDMRHFYGYDRSIALPEGDERQQVYNRFLAEGHMNNISDRGPLKYTGKIGLTYTGESFDAKETNVYGNFETSYELGKNSRFLVDVDVAYTNLNVMAPSDAGVPTEESYGRGFFKAKPAYAGQMDKLSYVLGGTVAYTGDTINASRKFSIYPALEASYQVIENGLVVFAGAGGDLERTTLFDLSRENPFLRISKPIADVNKGIEVYAGVNGSISKFVQFTGRVAHQRIRNLYFFNNAVSDSSKFEVVYDDGVTKVLQLYGELTFNQSEELRIGLKGEVNNYTTASLPEPFHRPSVKVTAFGTYNLYDKILFNTELYYISSSFGQITRPDGTAMLRETDNIIDLNLKADYRFSQRFSAFLMGNNLLNSQYQRLVNYQSQGISVLVGATYSF